MKTLVKSSTEDKSISQIEFGVLSIDEVVQLSHVKIFNNEIYDSQQIPVENGLMDPRLGPNDKGKCNVCEGDHKTCMGHFGHISLSNYLFPFGFLKDIVKILKCICKTCGQILLLDDDQRRYEKILKKPDISYISKKRIRLEIVKKCIKVRQCRLCKMSNGNIKKVKALSMIYHQKYILKDKQKLFTEKFNGFSEDMRALIGSGIELMRPHDVFKLFQLIPMKHYKYLGISAKDNVKISNLIFKHITVPPNCIRPSNLTSSVNQSREDDITILLRMQLADNKLNDMHNEYARMINPNASCLRSAKDKKFIRGIVQRLSGKKGRFRGNIMGKRTNFTSRTVISPDPYLRIDQVSIPEYCAIRLTLTERVTSYNIQYLKSMILNGPQTHPGAIGFASIPNDNGCQPLSNLKLMMTADIIWQKLEKPSWREAIVRKMKIGDYVERHIDNGDLVLFNRQPSLHRLSFQSFRVVVKQAKTFSFNPCCCNPFNADFDGDEMNVHFPQTYEARAEAQELISSVRNITSPNSGEPLTSPLQDILTAAYLLTSKDNFYTRQEFLHLAWRVLRSCPVDRKRLPLPKPAICHPQRLYTGKQLISFVISPFATTVTKDKENHNGRRKSHQRIESRINLSVETKPKSNEDLCSDDSYVVIHNSQLMIGQLTKKLLGGGSKSSIFFRLLRDVSEQAACSSMERLCQVALTDLKYRGFSIGIGDVSPDATLQSIKTRLVLENFRSCDDFIRSYENGSLTPDPGCSVEETLESRISSQLSKIRDQGGTQCKALLPKRNAPLIMALCGSKGSLINISQMIFCVGQQIIEGKRVSDVADTERTMIFCPINCRSPMSRGFVANSFFSGLNPVEFKFHAMSGREGLIDTAVKTAETGYLQRRLIKCLEDLAVQADGTVRDSEGSIVQFRYGIDGYDPAKLENTESPCDFDRELYHALQDYRNHGDDDEEDNEQDQNDDDRPIPHNQCLNVFHEILVRYYSSTNQRHLDQFQLDQLESLNQSLMETLRKYLQNNNRDRWITRWQLKSFVANCYEKFQRAIIVPGTPVGVICGQSVGEPATQMTLKTFHFAGVASMNISRGVPRMQEIMNAVANIKTPIITVTMDNEYDMAFAQRVQQSIQPIFLKDLIVQSQVVLCSTGMFFYFNLNDRKLRNLSIDQFHLQRVLSSVNIRDCLITVVFKEDGRMYIEVFSEREINCEVVLRVLEKVQVLGAPTVKRSVIQKNENGQYNIYVESGRLIDMFKVEGVDGTRTHSNHILEICDVLGIEAARQVIIQELNAVMGAHNLAPDIRHIILLAGFMCKMGSVCGFQRSGMSKSKNSVLNLASFEKTMDHLYEASFHNQKDNLYGVSDCITFGKSIQLGTGMGRVLWDNNVQEKLVRRSFVATCD